MTYEDLVYVKAGIPKSAFTRLHERAAHEGVDVAELVAKAATTEAMKVPEPRKRQWVRMTPEKITRAGALYRDGMLWRDIAAELGVSPRTLDNHKIRIIREGSQP